MVEMTLALRYFSLVLFWLGSQCTYEASTVGRDVTQMTTIRQEGMPPPFDLDKRNHLEYTHNTTAAQVLRSYLQQTSPLPEIHQYPGATTDAKITNNTDVKRKYNPVKNRTFLKTLSPNSSAISISQTTTTMPPMSSSTKKQIYIRGYLLKSHRTPSFHPAVSNPGRRQRPVSAGIHRSETTNFRSPPNGKGRPLIPPEIRHYGAANRRQKKHSNHKEKKFYNYKLIYDTLKNEDSMRHKQTEFYAWIFGATMLALGTLTTMTSCFVFCFCGEKMRKRRQKRKFDKSGEYERVDSVSSIVDYNSMGPPDLAEEQMDSVTII